MGFKNIVRDVIGFYGNNQSAWTLDLSLLCEKHTNLIDEVVDILEHEQRIILDAKMNRSRDLKQIGFESEHGTQANKICVLNDPKKEYIFLGDIHSDPTCIYRILDKINFISRYTRKKDIHLIFTGDYVDRGKNHLETLSCILLLKRMFPDAVTLLRGNHDGGIRVNGWIKLPYRIPDEDDPLKYFPTYTEALAQKNKTFSKKMTDYYLHFFDHLPLIALVNTNNKCVMALHGGLPRPAPHYGQGEVNQDNIEHFDHLRSAADLTSESILDYHSCSVVDNIMWSDPERVGEDLFLEKKRFRYTKKDFEIFIERFSIDYIVRGHEAHKEGIVTYFDNKLFTNFASGVFNENHENNDTAYDFVKSHALVFTRGGSFEKLSI